MVLHSLFALTLIVADAPKAARLPSADEIVAKMVQRDDERRSRLQGYASVRRYVLENVKHHKQAEMVVRMVYHKDGSKEFDVISSSGWGGARKHVFPRLLEAETEASRRGASEDSRVTPRNYSFTMLRTDEVGGRKAYVIEIIPKKQEKYLMRGTIWLDAEDFAIVRIEGEPAKNPSFWIKRVQFEHKYEKHGPFWLAASDTSTSDVRIFGPTELRIDYFDYIVNDAAAVEARLP
jgi:Outer membrane lipoprotein-sorting protein